MTLKVNTNKAIFEDLVKIDETERTRKQFQMMELLIYILRNVLLIPYKKNYTNIKEAYKADIQTKLFSQFSQPETNPRHCMKSIFVTLHIF